MIDGFNLYHSTREASADLGGVSTKWLDIRAFCASYLYTMGKDAILQDVFYFSALAEHLNAIDPGKVERHEVFIECLSDTGVKIELAKFKRKPDRICTRCGKKHKQHEEKETDVAIATKLLELVYTNACETVLLVTGDTDLAPAVRAARRAPGNKDVRFALPYKRHNRELRQLAPGSVRVGKERYAKHQFSDPFVLSSGREIQKPPSW